MKSHAKIIALSLLLAAGAGGDYAAAARQAPPTPGQAGYDEVGYAGIRPVNGSGPVTGTAVLAVHRSLPADTVVEITSLTTGKAALVLVTAQMPVPAGRVIDISPGAARLLGLSGPTGPVRVRRVVATQQDMAALRSGQPASPRMDSSPAQIAELRRRLGGSAPARGTAAAPAVPARTPYAPPAAAPRPAPQRSGSYYVQVAALSDGTRAQSLAASLGGRVQPGGGLYRIQLGPFATMAAAQQARAGAAQRGYADARIIAAN